MSIYWSCWPIIYSNVNSEKKLEIMAESRNPDCFFILVSLRSCFRTGSCWTKVVGACFQAELQSSGLKLNELGCCQMKVRVPVRNIVHAVLP